MYQAVMVTPPNAKYNIVLVFSRLLDLRQNWFLESLARPLAKGCAPVEMFNLLCSVNSAEMCGRTLWNP